ncbi:MAG: cytochrome [Pseudonocardiales bacterium]|nr:cytochrome [Pseudonocardiales bacterium]
MTETTAGDQIAPEDQIRADKCLAAETSIVRLFREREARASLYDRLRETRQSCPVHRSETLNQWVLTNYDDVKRVLRDRELAVDFTQQMDRKRPDWRDHPAFAMTADLMLSIDGPKHDRLRKIGLSVVNFRLVKRASDQIRETARTIARQFAQRGGGDFVTDVAFTFTAEVISDIMGLPHEDREWYRIAVSDHVMAFDPNVSADELKTADDAAVRIRQHWRAIVAERLSDPQDDVVSDLLNTAADDGDRLDNEEIAIFCEFLFSAGFETTVHTLGLGMLAFLENPDQLELFRNHRELSGSMVEEVLRYTSTIVGQPRFTSTDVTIGETAVPAGELLFVSLAGANRDPAAFPNPDAFDITRDDQPHVTFGHGRHLCLGAPLARAELQIMFEEIRDAWSSVELGPGGANYDTRLAPRALTNLDLIVRGS